jgi:hypothetical protein
MSTSLPRPTEAFAAKPAEKELYGRAVGAAWTYCRDKKAGGFSPRPVACYACPALRCQRQRPHAHRPAGSRATDQGASGADGCSNGPTRDRPHSTLRMPTTDIHLAPPYHVLRSEGER